MIKRILRRCEEPEVALLKHLSATKVNLTASLIQKFIGRPTRSVLQQIKPDNNQGWWRSRNERLHQRLNDNARDLAVLKERQPVLVRDWSQHRKKWWEAQIN